MCSLGPANATKMRTLLLLLCFSPVILTSGVPDETYILRLRPSSTVADQELHARTNALGKVLLDDNGTFINPLTSSPPLPSLSCVGTSHECAWKSDQEWRKTNISQEEKVFFKIPAAIQSCNFNNRCEWGCRLSTQGARECYCPRSYTLSNDGETCSPTHYSFKQNAFTKNEQFGLRGYGNSVNWKWLFIAPRGHVVKLVFSSIRTEGNYDMIYIHEGYENNIIWKISGYHDNITIISTSHALLVQFVSDGSNTDDGFLGQYLPRERGIPTLQLNNNEGYLSTPIVIPDMFCVTTVYTASSKENVSMYIGSSLTEATKLVETHYHQIGNWHIRRFKRMYNWIEIGMMQNLTVKMTGQGNKIMKIYTCDAQVDEDVYDLGITSGNTQLIRPASESKNCYNGGHFSTSYNACVCPSGFTGANCEEGCGPNRYGNDCNGICSPFGKDCQKLIFCKNDLPCFCAPGFKGKFCDDLCYKNHASSEYYGVNCSTKCGECHHGGCDPITGVCKEGCKDGYFPPLCQDTYSRITEAPRVMQRSWNSSRISINLFTLKGKGTPKFYQILLQERPSNLWMNVKTQLVAEEGLMNEIEGLKAQTKYIIKIVIINEDGQSYRGELIPLREFETTRFAPGSIHYHLRATNVITTGFSIFWKYEFGNTEWDSATQFEVTLHYGRQNVSYTLNAHESTKEFTNLQPGTTYHVTVQAITSKGRAPHSPKLSITTSSTGPGVVRLLTASPGARQVHVTWEKPWSTGGNITSYRVVYQCKKLLACPLSCEDSKGEKEVYGTSADIDNLIPHAQYLIGVAGKSSYFGPYSYIHSVTDQTVPSVTPVASGQPVVSNSSIAVQWTPPSCSRLNGYSEGYYYELIEVHQSQRRLLQHGTSRETSVSFHDLKPYTNFEVNVYALNMIGKNMDYNLSIPVQTAASAPEAVQSLTVYKTGRRMLGIRWAPPLRITGTLKSFSISYGKHSQSKIGETVGMKPCSAWPSLYCHTITKLVPDTNYDISVQAHIMETDNDGQVANITAVTREGVPGVPTNLHVSKVTNESLQIEWGLPYIINGMLRSFLINVEHADSLDEADCCEYFPVQELPVHDEAPVYSLEVTGLRPAAIYTVSVSAKTLTMGPAVNVTHNTSPPMPINMIRPEIISKEDGACRVKLIPSTVPPGLNGTYLLMILPNKDYPEPEIFDKELALLLSESVHKSFYIVAEFNEKEVQKEIILKIGNKTSAINGKTAVLQDPELPQEYDVGLALVFDYGGAKSVGFVSSV